MQPSADVVMHAHTAWAFWATLSCMVSLVLPTKVSLAGTWTSDKLLPDGRVFLTACLLQPNLSRLPSSATHGVYHCPCAYVLGYRYNHYERKAVGVGALAAVSQRQTPGGSRCRPSGMRHQAATSGARPRAYGPCPVRLRSSTTRTPN